MEDIGYCVKCKTKRTMKDVVEETTPNNRRMRRGTCEVCGTKMTKFVSSKEKKA